MNRMKNGKRSRRLLPVFSGVLLILVIATAAFLFYSHRKAAHEETDQALLDYYRVAEIDRFLTITHLKALFSVRYAYRLEAPPLQVAPGDKSISPKAVWKISWLFQQFIDDRFLGTMVSLEPEPTARDYPVDIMRLASGSHEFYHPASNAAPYRVWEDDKQHTWLMGKRKEFTEFSLSFDKGYTVGEIQRMLAGKGTIKWYWVDTYQQHDVSLMQVFKTGAYPKRRGSTNGDSNRDTVGQAFGFKAVDEQNRKLEHPESGFLEVLAKYRHPGTNLAAQKLCEIGDGMAGRGRAVAPADIRILGVVIQAKPLEILELQDAPYLRGVFWDQT